jgi:hypothetical protein
VPTKETKGKKQIKQQFLSILGVNKEARIILKIILLLLHSEKEL